jgi:hypothetical protein
MCAIVALTKLGNYYWLITRNDTLVERTSEPATAAPNTNARERTIKRIGMRLLMGATSSPDIGKHHAESESNESRET